MIEVGKSYDADDLAKLCGDNYGGRYGHHAFVGERATVIAQDEGNGVVKVVQIIRQIPQCPMCHKVIGTIHTSRTVILVHVDGQWREEHADYHYFVSECPECLQTFSSDDLDKLGVPSSGQGERRVADSSVPEIPTFPEFTAKYGSRPKDIIYSMALKLSRDYFEAQLRVRRIFYGRGS